MYLRDFLFLLFFYLIRRDDIFPSYNEASSFSLVSLGPEHTDFFSSGPHLFKQNPLQAVFSLTTMGNSEARLHSFHPVENARLTLVCRYAEDPNAESVG